MKSAFLSEYSNNTERCNSRLRYIDHVYFMPRLKQESIGDGRVSIGTCTSVPLYSLQWMGISTDGMLDKMIIYTINRGAITRSILSLSHK